MLLRRVIKHVRDQNWFAVGLDFLIVVSGVFIGIQVANWNDDRRERLEEQAVLERLHQEVRALIDIQRDELAANEAWARRMISINPVLFGQEPPRELTRTECWTIVGTHVFLRPTDELSVLDELRDSGRFDLIRNSSLKARLRDYILLRERGRGHYREISNELFRLHSRHPDVVQVIREKSNPSEARGWNQLSGEGYRWQAICDVPAMREKPQFLNEYMDNASRRGSHMARYEQRITSLIAIDELLRAEAGQEPADEAGK
jgi:hypothetical protein